ncbi:uncharacterized protein LOC110684553 [Chenopodium quinoa]|uniref:uncharacterized protein LOC110684553 n=1 Tax=Chenopodium quinoa TaxID=63459 RepID=UPI000B78A4F8|nr:uncharacterized protein LOC110684553 [Chenopodium quinoa]
MFLRSDGGPTRAQGIEARTRRSLVVADDLLRFIGILSLSGSLNFLSRFRRLSGSSLSLPSCSSTFRVRVRVSGSGSRFHSLHSLSLGHLSLLWIMAYIQLHRLGASSTDARLIFSSSVLDDASTDASYLFCQLTGPALSLTATGVTGTSRDTTQRTRMMAGLFGSPLPYSQAEDDTDPHSSSSTDF